MDAVQTAHASLQTHGRTFSLAARFLPVDRRDDAAVLYALCRYIDDLADEATDVASARRALAGVRAQLRGDAPADGPVAAWLEVEARRGVAREPLDALIVGVESDLEPVRIPDDPALIVYSYRVAGTVGLLMCGVLGVDAPAAAPLAVDLGVAMQLTNICRDVREDAARGRVYLPADRLRRAGTSPEAILDGSAPPAAVAAVVRELLAEADRRYARGERGLRYLPRRCRFAIRVAARLYRAIGVRLRRRGCDPMFGRTVVPWHEKLVGLIDAVCRPLPLLPEVSA